MKYKVPDTLRKRGQAALHLNCVKITQTGDHAGLQVILTSSGGRNGAWLLLEERHLPLASNLQTIAASPTQIWEFKMLQSRIG